MGALAFLFGGPGVAEPGMGRDLYNKSLVVRESVDHADRVLTELGGVRPTKACFAGDAALISRPSVAGPALMALAHGVVKALKAKRLHPQVAAGFGWGSLVALVALGGLDFDMGLEIIYRRGKAAEEAWEKAPWHVLAVQGLPWESLAGHLEKLPQPVQRVALLSPDSFVLSGPEAVLKALQSLLERAGRGVKVTPSEPGWQWPHPALEEANAAAAKALEAVKLEWVPAVQAAADAEALRQSHEWPSFLLRWGNQPLDWPAACRRLKSSVNVDTAVEIGHGAALGAALHKMDTGSRVLDTSDFTAFAKALKLAY